MAIKDKSRIIFTGDIAFSRYFKNGWEMGGCIDHAVEEYLKNADNVVINLESPLTNRKITSTKELNHASNPEAGKYLSATNMNIWNLANNHILDCDIEGLKDTLEIAQDNCCRTLGVGFNIHEALEPVILGETVRIGLISVASATWKYLMADENSPGAVTWDKTDYLRNSMTALRQAVDWIVLVVHGGDENCDISMPYIREKYHGLLDLGADIIVGHHPHVVQDYEWVGKKIIFYSLGNFIFDTENQRKFFHTEQGILLQIDFERESFSFECMGVHIDRSRNIVCKGNIPPVFCGFDETEYSKLWPLAAKNFYKVNLWQRQKKSVRLRSANGIILFGHELLACRHKKERIIQQGRILSVLEGWRSSSSEELKGYLNEWNEWKNEWKYEEKSTMSLKIKLQNILLRFPIGRKFEAHRRIDKIASQYLQEEKIHIVEQQPDKKCKVVNQYIEKYPHRFNSDKEIAHKLIEVVPSFIKGGTAEEQFSELMFYRVAYGFHPEEYVCYEFGDKDLDECMQFVSARECYAYTLQMNDILAVEVFDNKGKTYDRFKQYYLREAVYIKNQDDFHKYKSFIANHPVFVKKEVYEAMGRGVELVDLSTLEVSDDKYFEQLIQMGPHLLEDRIIQSAEVGLMNESSVNTVRCISFYTRNGVITPYYFMKVGRKGSFVDNGGAGGILIGIDAESGKLCTDGFDEYNRRYELHPDSGVRFKGFQLPQWEQMKAMCIEMSEQIPEVKYIGWDLAHTDNGWVLVEGNGHSQMIGPQTIFKRGMKKEMETMMKNMDLVIRGGVFN